MITEAELAEWFDDIGDAAWWMAATCTYELADTFRTKAYI